MPESLCGFTMPDVFKFLQILQLNDGEKLNLNEANLEKVVSGANGKPIEILSVVGKAHSGKSFLIGGIIKYLTDLEENHHEWLDRSATECLTTDLNWENKRSPDNTGAWIYDRGFTISVKNENGEPLDIFVLLMYVQAPDVKTWTKLETSALVGLNLRISSCTIFNTQRDITETYLSSLAHVIKCTIPLNVHNGQTESLPDFGNAFFVIRDWGFPSKYSYGVTRGTEFVIDNKLRNKPSHSQLAQSSRKLITSFFSNISGCLLPFPGNKTMSVGRKGQISEFDKHFVTSFRELMIEVLNLDELKLKTSENGEMLNHENIVSTFRGFLERLHENSAHDKKRISDVLKSLHLPTTTQCNVKDLIDLAVSAFRKKWDEHQSKKPFLQPEVLKKVLLLSKQQSYDAVRQKLRDTAMVDSDDEDPVMDIDFTKTLQKKLQELSEAFTTENQTRRTKHLQICTQELLEQYNLYMAAFLSSENSVSISEIQSESEEYQADKLKDFMTEMWGEVKESEDTNDEEDSEWETFIQKLKEAESKWTTPAEHQIASQEVKTHAHQEGQYSRSFNFIQSNAPSQFAYTSLDKLNNYEDTNMSMISTVTSLASTLTCNSDPEKLFDERNNTKQLTENLKLEYEAKLLSIHGSLDELEHFHSSEMPQILAKFDAANRHQPNAMLVNLQKETLKDYLHALYLKAVERLSTNINSTSALIVSAIQKETNVYKTQMERKLETNPFILHGDLEQAHANHLKDCWLRLRNEQRIQDSAEAAQMFHDSIDNIYMQIKAKNQQNKQMASNDSLALIQSSKNDYIEAMRLAQKANTDLSEESRHKTSVKEVLDNFEKTSPIKRDSKLLIEHMQKLSTLLDNEFHTQKTKTQLLRRSSSIACKEKTKEALFYYNDEMSKFTKNNGFSSVKEFHKKTSKEAISRCRKANVDPVFIRQLQQNIDASYKKFDDLRDMKANLDPAIGIDLGTTFCCASIYNGEEVCIIPNSVGNLTTPSYVHFQENGKYIAGDVAKQRAHEDPRNTIYDAKRILGRPFEDKQLQADIKCWPFRVINNGNGSPLIAVNNTTVHPEVVSSKLLAEIKRNAEAYLKRPVKKAVITVPAYFTDGQRQATVDAGEMAGLKVLTILNEPVAAAMAYQLQYSAAEEGFSRYVIVFDFGGGTFDIAILRVSKGAIQVVCVDGDTHLGGEDIDRNMMIYCASEFKKAHNIDLLEDKDSLDNETRNNASRSIKRLQAACERGKILLSGAKHVEVTIDRVYQEFDLKVHMTRDTFEKINSILFDRVFAILERSMNAAAVEKSQIQDIVLVGGSTRIPKIRRMIQENFPGITINNTVNPDQAVAYGAALSAAILSGNVNKSSDYFTSVQDVTPMSLGVELYGGGFSVIIPKSTPVPVKAIEKYKTAHNNQTSVQITIFQGEEQEAKRNTWLGDFYLNGIPPKKAGEENIEVEMVINTQGILHVTAKCSTTGNKFTKSVVVTENKQRMGAATKQRFLDA